MIKPCKCGSDLLMVKVRVSGLAEHLRSIDNLDYGMETDGLVYKYQTTVYCSNCLIRKDNLTFHPSHGVMEKGSK